jgi:hypothetical protein
MAQRFMESLNQFNPDLESWECYFERFEQFVLVNDIEQEKQVACLLSLLGPVTYNVLRNLSHPTKPSTKTLAQINGILNEHYTEKKFVIAERFRFYGTIQKPDESVNDFIARLKDLSRFCEFGESLTDMIRDKLV